MAHDIDALASAILESVPPDGSSIGNGSLRERVAERLGVAVDESDYAAARDALVEQGKLAKGKGRGGSVRRILDTPPALTLQVVEKPAGADLPKPRQAGLSLAQARKAKAEVQARRKDDDARLIAYRHEDKRTNNPDVGVVTPDNDPDQPRTVWAYDPHIDPALNFDTGRARIEALIDDALASGSEESMRAALEQLRRMAAPYLDWTGKAERTSFEVDTVSLHVHERIDPASILAVIQKRMKAEQGEHAGTRDLFRAWFEEPLPLREAVDFYKHERGWTNRLVAGDSLLVMNSLLQKEGMAGQVQMIYIDPPYGIKYGSNFQPFVNKRDVKDRKDEDLTQEPEMIKAFRDTWELGIHSYLTYLRDRLLLAKELLHESGSVFVQISDENLHHVRELCDEIFGSANMVSLVTFQKTSSASGEQLGSVSDYLVWYSKHRNALKFRGLFLERAGEGWVNYDYLRTTGCEFRRMSTQERRDWSAVPNGAAIYRRDNLTSQRPAQSNDVQNIEFRGATYDPGKGTFKTDETGLRRLAASSRLEAYGRTLAYRRFAEDFPFFPYNNLWADTLTGGFAEDRYYVVQTTQKVIERCLLMTTDPGDLVLDPTCGSGTTAYVAEKWGRRWITCDTSRVAVTLAKQRLMTASYDYYELRYPHEGLKAGFIYRTVPHVTLKSIANNPEIDEIWERMHPAIERALGELNGALSLPSPRGGGAGGEGSGAPIRFTITEGGRKGQVLRFGVSQAQGENPTLSPPPLSGGEGPTESHGQGLLEWEVPFDFPADWPDAARAAFDAFHTARQAMQRRMDESIAAHADQEVLYDQPQVSKDKLRIAGPFTVEAVPFPAVLALDALAPEAGGNANWEADASIARSGESARQHRWRDELLKTGIRGKGGQMLKFVELETLPDTRHLHCSGHTEAGERVVVSFGPEHAALEQRQVELAMREAGELFPRPKLIVFCAFAFDPEAAKDIDATKGIVALKAQMNTDLLTEDLKKNARHNQSFWLMGQPDVEVHQVTRDGKRLPKGQADKDGRLYYAVEVHGFDYFDPTASDESKRLVSGGKGKIAAWSLDTDYDERSLYPRQVFFPMAGKKDGWHKLKRDIKAELDESRLDQLHGTVSLSFQAGENRKIAVKIVDDRGIESLKVIALP